VTVAVEARSERRTLLPGLDPSDLAARVAVPGRTITEVALTHWLGVLDGDGRLVPTSRGLELAAALDEVGLGN
jgi:hypothetical protein